MFIACAQCEKADATLLCKVENLHYCEPCCRALHAKKARRHHHVQPFLVVPICDECEDATAEVECLSCGGTDVIALVFCKECSLSLHSRAARSRHCVKAISSKRKRDSVVEELGCPTAGLSVIDLTTIDSDEENRVPYGSNSKHCSRASSAEAAPIKQEGLSPPRKVAKTVASENPGKPVKPNDEAQASTVANEVPEVPVKTPVNEDPGKSVKLTNKAPASPNKETIGNEDLTMEKPIKLNDKAPISPHHEQETAANETPDQERSVKTNVEAPASPSHMHKAAGREDLEPSFKLKDEARVSSSQAVSNEKSNLERPCHLKDVDPTSPNYKQKTHEAQVEVNEAQVKVNEAQVEVNLAQVAVNSAQVEVDETQVEVDETQVEVDEAQVPEQPTEVPNNGPSWEDSFSSDSDVETTDANAERNGVHVIRRGTISVEAFVVDDPDMDENARPRPSDTVPESNVELSIKNKIKNMLELGLHPNTPEFEAQQALKNAQRLLSKYNLEQIEVMGVNLEDGRSSFTPGMRMVEIRSKGKVKYGRMERWIWTLCGTIRSNFDCEYYSLSATASQPLTIVFYGIRQNANCAGYAFSATFNRITVMAAAYGPVNDSATKPTPALGRGVETRVARTNYRKGVAAGLEEALMRKKADSQALVIHSKKAAEEFKKQTGLKVRIVKCPNRNSKWNAEAYEQGKKDSETIDIDQKGITRGKGTGSHGTNRSQI